MSVDCLNGTETIEPMNADFKDPYIVEARTVINLTAERAMQLLKQRMPEGRQMGSIYSCDTTWELHGEAGKLRWIYLVDGFAPNLGPTILTVTSVTDLSDFQPHTAAYAVKTLNDDAADESGVVPTLGIQLERLAIREDMQIRVLYVNSDENEREQMEHYLRYQFPDVVLETAATPREAMNIANNSHFAYDIVVCEFGDHNGFNAISFISELRKRSDGVTVQAYVFGAPGTTEAMTTISSLDIQRLNNSSYRTVTDAVRRSVSGIQHGHGATL